jgi:thiamine kinase-like enzyme
MRAPEPAAAAGRTARALGDADLAAILDAVPFVPGPRAERRLERVTGGLTNVNVKVTTPERKVIARIATQDSALLAIDREAEHANSLAAASAGAAPEVVGRSAAAGVLVVEWVEGRTLAAADLREDANLPRVAAVCRRLHAGPRFRGDFDIFDLQARYLHIVAGHGFRLPPGYLGLMPEFERIGAALAVHPAPLVPCHNDLLAENFIDDGERLWLVDFEYSGNNEACFELGNIAAESELSPAQLTELVRLYLGPRASAARLRAQVARARLLALASKYGWTLWGVIQHGVSTVDFDFWAWATSKYERARAEFADPGFSRLLEEVTAPD